jgi:FkbM family methyltransferase
VNTSDMTLVHTAHGPMWVFRTDQYVSRSLELYGEYAKGETELFAQIAGPGMTVVEAGANIGAHSVALAKMCAPGPLYLFEPQQRVFQLLCANLALNGITNARAYPEGLGRKDEVLTLTTPNYAAPGNFGSVSLKHGGGDARARVAPLDNWGLDACHVMKIDVEGWEVDVLQGARETIAKFRPAIFVENDRKSQQAPLISLLDQYGYRCFWHVSSLYSPNNFNRNPQNVFGPTVALNMFCIHKEDRRTLTGMDEINPRAWRSPIPPIDDTVSAAPPPGKGIVTNG